MSDERKKSGFDYREWFQKNKDKINERRRLRYRQDPRYRERVKARAKFRYWTKERKEKDVENARAELDKMEPAEVVPIRITNPDDARYGKTIDVNCYTAGQLGALLYGRSTQTMRLWERNGIIPEPKLRNAKGHRLYTEDQMEMFLNLRHLVQIKSKSFYKDSLFSREVFKAWEHMPDGVKVVPAVMKKAKCTDPMCTQEDTVRVPESGELPVVLCTKCGGRMKILE